MGNNVLYNSLDGSLDESRIAKNFETTESTVHFPVFNIVHLLQEGLD